MRLNNPRLPDFFRSGNYRRGTGRKDLPECHQIKLSQMIGKDAVIKRKDSVLTMMTDKDDILLNSREVAFLLDLSPDTVNEFARRNILPAFKKGRQWRFRKRDIASFKRHMRGINAAA
ncbi:MAG TPA: helix-turn-helix domain-containing protein [Candidatus Binataceae bacterium]|nr:helix-turn-helix domain-containing protein [Candidatus Binataceae bacterium]